MARVNLDHLDTPFLGFVGEEAMELGKAPTMEPTLILGMLLHGGPVSNIRQVLKHDGCALWCVLHNALGDNMIVISALPKQFTREFTQVTFRALCAFGLQFPTKAEATTFLLFPTTFSQEVALAGHSGTIETQVNPDHFSGWRNSWLRNGDGDMQ